MNGCMPVAHCLKCEHQYFLEVVDKVKTFEVRLDDRHYKVNDYLVLYDYKNGVSQQRYVIAKVTYILRGFVGLEEGYVVLGIELCTSVILSC